MNAPVAAPGMNKQWVERRAKAVSRGISAGAPVIAARAENSEIWDIEGNRYVDFGGGIAVVNTGHRHPLVMKRVYEQLEAFTHTCAMVMPYAPFIEVCEKLNAVAPISGEKKSALVTTGAEAVENAVKFARAYTGRSDIIAFNGGFHGRTLLGMTLTGKVVPYKAKFGPMAPGVWHVPFPVAHKGVTVDDTMHAIEWLFKADVEPQRVAAIIIEPVQGEGGFYIAPKELMVKLRKLCDDHGILLIADEIQSGFGRTGKFFAMEHYGVEPDLITSAKSLAGGFPLAAVVGRAKIMDAPDPGGIGGTYAGNPVACAAALGRVRRLRAGRPAGEGGSPGQDHHGAHEGDQGQGQAACRSATCAALAPCAPSSSSPSMAATSPMPAVRRRSPPSAWSAACSSSPAVSMPTRCAC